MKKDTRSTFQKIKDDRHFYDEWDRGYLEGLKFAMENINRLDDPLLTEAKRITDSYEKRRKINENDKSLQQAELCSLRNG